MATDIDAPQNMRSGTILIVDDDEGIREMLTSLIETETPYHPLVFGSADETLKCMTQIIEAKPILFILDYRLLTMTGLDLYDRLHQHTALGKQPAIMLTAVGRDEHMERATAQRQIEMLTKPFEIEDLLCCIKQTLSYCGTRM